MVSKGWADHVAYLMQQVARSLNIEDAIARGLEGRRREFTSWVTDFGLEYAEQVREDHVRFVNAFREGHIGVSAT